MPIAIAIRGQLLVGILMNSEIYVNRHNHKLFDSTIEVSAALESHLDTVIHNTPMQEPYDKFIIIKLKNSLEDIKIKEFYLTHVFKNEKKGIYFPAMASAPLVYIVLRNCNIGSQADVSVGLQAGTVMSEVLHAGLDISVIGCTADIGKKIVNKSKTILKDRFKKLNVEKYFVPSLCLCIGKGISVELTHVLRNNYITSDGRELPYGPYFNDKKPNILFT